MAFKVLLLVAAAVAVSMADEAVREKKDVMYQYGAYPYSYGAYPQAYGYDDGKYYPGKYEKASFYSAPAAYHTGYVAPTTYSHAAYPYSYGAYPYSYGAYPYSYGAYPSAKHVVY